jgi:hypothetical protein
MTSTIVQNPAAEAPKGTFKRLLWVAPVAMLTATAADLALYAAAGRFNPEITAWPGAGAAQIAGANFVYLFIGAALLAVTARLFSHPARVYAAAATLGLLLSLALPISASLGNGAPGIPVPGASTVLTLSLMHVVTFAISLPMFVYLALPQGTR